MRKLFLIANMTLPAVELAVGLFISKLKERTEQEANYEVLFGRADYPPRIHHRSILIFLGTESYKTNLEYINPSAIGIILDNGMTLGCISGENVKRFDFKVRKDVSSIRLRHREPIDLMLRVKNAFFDDKSTGVHPNCLARIPNTLVPNVLSSIKETTKFAKEFAALNYSVRNELDRDRIRREVFKWVMSKETPAQLHESLQRVIGKNTAPVRNLVETFDPDSERYAAHALNIRQALSVALNYVKAGKNNVPYEGIADKFKVSPYDLKYAGYLFKKDPLLIADLQSKDVHYNNSKFRSTGAPTSTVEEPVTSTV
jgi:hypothetical protein